MLELTGYVVEWMQKLKGNFRVRLLHKIDINPDHQVLRNDQSVLLARSSHGNNVLVSFHSSTEAYVYNARRAKHLSTMKVQVNVAVSD